MVTSALAQRNSAVALTPDPAYEALTRVDIMLEKPISFNSLLATAPGSIMPGGQDVLMFTYNDGFGNIFGYPAATAVGQADGSVYTGLSGEAPSTRVPLIAVAAAVFKSSGDDFARMAMVGTGSFGPNSETEIFIMQFNASGQASIEYQFNEDDTGATISFVGYTSIRFIDSTLDPSGAGNVYFLATDQSDAVVLYRVASDGASAKKIYSDDALSAPLVAGPGYVLAAMPSSDKGATLLLHSEAQNTSQVVPMGSTTTEALPLLYCNGTFVYRYVESGSGGIGMVTIDDPTTVRRIILGAMEIPDLT